MAALDLNISDKDATLIKDIIQAAGIGGHRAIDMAMDLSIVHANHAPLALRMMLAYAQRQDLLGDVIHDLSGITKDLDRRTGKLAGFYPRFTLGYYKDAFNVNPETGIRYGYIKADSLHYDVVDHITFGIGKDLSYEEARKEEEKRLEARAEAIEDEVRITLAERGGSTDREYESVWDKEVEAAYAREGYADRECFIEKQVEDFNQAYQCDEPIHEFEYEGVKGRTSWLGGALHVWVFDSPEVGWYQQCSPCVPRAGNLDQPDDDGVLTYTVPKSWLREES